MREGRTRGHTVTLLGRTERQQRHCLLTLTQPVNGPYFFYSIKLSLSVKPSVFKLNQVSQYKGLIQFNFIYIVIIHNISPT